MQDDNGKLHILQHAIEENDLGIWIEPTLKFSTHVARVANKAHQILGLIHRSFTYIDVPLLKQLYTALVRPHLEYGNPVWHPFLKKRHSATRKGSTESN